MHAGREGQRSQELALAMYPLAETLLDRVSGEELARELDEERRMAGFRGREVPVEAGERR